MFKPTLRPAQPVPSRNMQKQAAARDWAWLTSRNAAAQIKLPATNTGFWPKRSINRPVAKSMINVEKPIKKKK